VNPLRAARQLVGPRAFTQPYQGASVSRHTADWHATLLPPDMEIGPGLRVLRARSRDMHRNSPHATGFTRDLRTNVIGVHEQGIRLQARNRKYDGSFDKATNDTIEAAFALWGQPESASADGQSSWGDLQRLYVTTLAVDGEVLWRELPGFANDCGYALEILDADQIDETLNRTGSATENEIRYGVEVDRYNRPVAFWMFRHHPNDWKHPRVRERVPAEGIHLDFVQTRPGQTRGVPWLAPALFLWRHWEGFTQAEVMQARAAACMGGFFTATGEDAQMWVAPDGAMPGAGSTMEMALEPNLYRQLPPGLSYEGVQPMHPNPNAPEFRRDILMTLSRALGPSFTSMSGDFSNTNYSSGRMGLLPERDFYRAAARWTTQRFHRLVYRGFLQAATLSGMLDLPSLDVRQYLPHKWSYRGWPWIDPENDARAKAMMQVMGASSPQQICDELGVDLEENLEEIQEAQRLFEQYGVPWDPAAVLNRPPTATTTADPNAEGVSPTTTTGKKASALTRLQLLAEGGR
jgi:lambda family phage portal protein